MNRQIKILSILLIISGTISIIVLSLFLIYVSDDLTLFDNVACISSIIIIPLTLTICLIREIRIAKYPLKQAYSEIVNLQVKWDSLSHSNDFLVTFKISDNLYWTLNVPVELFNILAIGQYGKLTYREKNSRVYFVFFTSLDDQNKTDQSGDGSIR